MDEEYIVNNNLYNKASGFARRIVKLQKYLVSSKKEYQMSQQILKSGTSIGANIAEAVYASSNADYLNKLRIALKETNETEYWLRLLIDTEYIEKEAGNSILRDCLEIKKILISIVNKLKTKD